MSKQLDIKKLHLPVPGRLVPGVEMPAGGALRGEALAGFLAQGVKDTAAIEAWVRQAAAAVAELPRLTGEDKLSPRQKIYDRYFDVGRHGGSAVSITFALGQVMAEISREMQLGATLDEQEINRLLDGLAAVMEAASEC